MLGNHAIVVSHAALGVLLLSASDEGGAVFSSILAGLSLHVFLGSLVLDITEFLSVQFAFNSFCFNEICVDLVSCVDGTFNFLVSTKFDCVGSTEESSDEENSGVHCFLFCRLCL